MKNLSFEVPMSVFAAGIIICVLSELGSVWHFFSESAVSMMFLVGVCVGLLGITFSGVIYARQKLMHAGEDECQES